MSKQVISDWKRYYSFDRHCQLPLIQICQVPIYAFDNQLRQDFLSENQISRQFNASVMS